MQSKLERVSNDVVAAVSVLRTPSSAPMLAGAESGSFGFGPGGAVASVAAIRIQTTIEFTALAGEQDEDAAKQTYREVRRDADELVGPDATHSDQLARSRLAVTIVAHYLNVVARRPNAPTRGGRCGIRSHRTAQVSGSRAGW